jgi:Eukaryotic initiation factor 4E
MFLTVRSPDYHDPVNAAGVRFNFHIKDEVSFDGIWLRVVKFMLTARFIGAENINGALVNIRTEDGNVKRIIAIWTKNAQQIKPIDEALKADFEEKFYYVTHQRIKQKSAQKRK